jgi:very-short-patch-repair endonuclease
VPLPRQARVKEVLVHRSRLEPADCAAVRGIPVTSVARSLIDLAGCVSEERLERLLDHALVNRLVRRIELTERAEALGRAGRKGAGVLAALLEARPESRRPMGSEFEGRLFRALEAARLPVPVPQFRVVLPGGDERFLDFAYPEVKLAIEADSYLWHASREAWERDRERNNELIALGWSFLPLTWSVVRYRPAEAARQVQDSLETRRAG